MKKHHALSAACFISSLSLAYAPDVLADLQFIKAGFSIGTVHDEHIEFFDRDNDQLLDAITYGASQASLFEARENGYAIASQEAFNNNGLHTSKYITVEDMNGDGYTDLITYPFRVLINNQQGHFTAIPSWHPFSKSGDYFKLQKTDLDQNGQVDLFLTAANRSNGSFSGDTVLLMNVRYDPQAPNSGYFAYDYQVNYSPNSPPLLGNITSMKPNGVAIGDLNNDGMPDVIFINSDRGKLRSSTSSITLNNGSGSLVFSQAISAAEDIAIGDLDNDGDLDLYLARSGFQADEVWFNDGQGIFTKSGQYLGSDDSINAAMADMDGDGDLDVVATSHNDSQNHPHRIWLNNGNGQFNDTPINVGSGLKTETLKLIDLDRDGDTDIVTLGGRGYHPYQSGLFLSTNEIWLNQLITQEPALGFADGIAHCQNNPQDYGLFTQIQLEEAIDYAFSEGVLACQSEPNNYGLFTQAELDASYQSGLREGQLSCQADPGSCQLFTQNDLDQAFINGFSQGELNGILKGKQSCIDEPFLCGLYDLNALEEASAKGYQAGVLSGQQACIDEPASCGLYDLAALTKATEDAYNNGLIQGKQICIDEPEDCGLYDEEDVELTIEEIVLQIVNELPKGQIKSVCKKQPDSLLCMFNDEQEKPKKKHKKKRKKKQDKKQD